MVKQTKIVCLCGSTKFKDEFIYHTKRLTLDGYIVLSVGVFSHQEPETLAPDVIDALNELHLRKIDIADEVLAICPGDYIGEGLKRELEYAKSLNIPIQYDKTKVEKEGK